MNLHIMLFSACLLTIPPRIRAGSRWAPDAMRQVSANFESYNPTFGIDLVDLPIYDAGNLETSALVDETLQNLYEATKDLLKDGKLPIMLGGEHSLTFAMVKACAEFAGEDFGVLVLDAHFDLREEYRGFKHNHACVSRNILNRGYEKSCLYRNQKRPGRRMGFCQGK